MPLSTKPYKGARDFYPEDKRLQKYIFNRLRQAVELYGYEEYDTPILEPLEIFASKTCEEIVKEQTYLFEDRAGRKVVIRPEMTPSVSRLVAGRRQELAYPLRWYSIPNLWRYERPQKGRLREHWQLNVDIFGVADTSAEVEMMLLVNSIFQTFNAKPDMFDIRINSRQLTNYLLEDYLGLNQKTANMIGKLIDKLHKLERTEFINKLDEALNDKQRAAGVPEKLLALLEVKSLKSLPAEVQAQAAVADIESVLVSLGKAGISNARFDITLMRGFDYYTGIVFEVYDTNPENNRSMLGGGRYDGLVGLFGAEAVPTVGFGWGDVTLANFLELHHLTPDLKSETEISLVLAGLPAEAGQQIADNLRSQGINTAVDISGRKLGDQIKSAAKKGHTYVLVAGEDELKNQRFNLKNLVDGQEKQLSVGELVKKFRS
jgi:histidyl-tRNA synthetase